MANFAYLKFNDPAPDVEVLTADGKPVRLSKYWKRQTVVLAFSRHFGCPQCKEMFDTLVNARPELEKQGLKLIIVTQGTPEQTATFCAERAPGVTCLADPQRAAYRAYGLERGSLFQILLSPNIWKSNKRLAEQKGWKPEKPPKGQDAFVMSGTFIIGRDGRIRMPYYYEDIADHPPIDLLLHGIMGMKWDVPLDVPIQPGVEGGTDESI